MRRQGGSDERCRRWLNHVSEKKQQSPAWRRNTFPLAAALLLHVNSACATPDRNGREKPTSGPSHILCSIAARGGLGGLSLGCYVHPQTFWPQAALCSTEHAWM